MARRRTDVLGHVGRRPGSGPGPAPALAPRPGAPPRAAAPAQPARGRSFSDHGPRLAAALTMFAGLLNLVSAFLPAERDRLQLLSDVVPGFVSEGATVVTAAAGIGLVLLAGGLRRRSRAAWLATTALLMVSSVLHLTKGLDYEEALLEAFLAGLLVAQGGKFTARFRARERRPVLGPALGAAAITAGYGVLGLVSSRRDVVQDLSAVETLREVARMAIGLGTTLTLTGRFGRFFPASVAAVCYVGALAVAARALAPVLVRRVTDPGLPAAVAASGDSLAYFALRDDRSSVRAGDALVAYAVQGTVALAAGDPLGPPAQWPAAAAAFLAEAADQGRVAAVLGCGAEAAGVWRAAGLATVYLGDEAVLDLDRFTLEGRAVRIARQSWNRARRAGFEAVVCRAGDLDPATASELRELARHWRGGAAERGFSMALGRLFDPRDTGALVVAARDPEGRLRGFLHLVPWGADGASLDVMRRDRAAPAVLNDFLVVEAARQLPAFGVRRLSLNFSFLRAVLAAGAEPGAPARLRAGRWLLCRLSRRFQIESLYRFNKKFAPAWQPRYLAVEAPEELPRVAVAALKAEGLLEGGWRLPLGRRDAGDRGDAIVGGSPLRGSTGA